MIRRSPRRYFLASVLLLAALAALFGISEALRTQQELTRQLDEKGLALAGALEISSRNAILSNARLTEPFFAATPGEPQVPGVAPCSRERRDNMSRMSGR